MFATLSDRLTATFKSLRGKGRLSEADVDATVREIRRALLDADVALPVVREFTAAVRERALGAEVAAGAEPGAAGRPDRPRRAGRGARRRDPPAAAGEDPADRHPARGPAGRRQDHAGRQARPLAAGSRATRPLLVACRPAAAERGRPAEGRRRAGRRRGVRAAPGHSSTGATLAGPGDPVAVARDGVALRPGQAVRRRHRRHRRPARRRRGDDAAGGRHPRRRRPGRDPLRARRHDRPGRRHARRRPSPTASASPASC